MGEIPDRTGLHHRLVNVTNLAEATEPGSTAAVLTSENLRAAPFGTAMRHAGAPADPCRSKPHQLASRPTPQKQHGMNRRSDPSRPQTTVRPQGGGQDHSRGLCETVAQRRTTGRNRAHDNNS